MRIFFSKLLGKKRNILNQNFNDSIHVNDRIILEIMIDK